MAAETTLDKAGLADSKELKKAIGQVYEQEFKEALQGLSKLRERTSDDPQAASILSRYIRICEIRLAERSEPDQKDSQANYDRGVYHFNRGEHDLAMKYLSAALQATDGDSSHVHYAMAACEARQRNAEKALGHLKEAIRHRRQSGYAAQGDPDFREVISAKQLKELLSAE